jgi:hypothetical protein
MGATNYVFYTVFNIFRALNASTIGLLVHKSILNEDPKINGNSREWPNLIRIFNGF